MLENSLRRNLYKQYEQIQKKKYGDIMYGLKFYVMTGELGPSISFVEPVSKIDGDAEIKEECRKMNNDKR